MPTNCALFETPCPSTSAPLHGDSLYPCTHSSTTKKSTYSLSEAPIGMFKYLILQGLSNWFQMSLGWAWNCKPWVWACFSIDESYSFPFRKYLLLLFIICPLVILKISKWLWASHQKTDMEMPGNITSYVAVQYMDIQYHVLWYNWVGINLSLSPGKTWLA